VNAAVPTTRRGDCFGVAHAPARIGDAELRRRDIAGARGECFHFMRHPGAATSIGGM
jgi:hypothetical protein